MKKLLIALLFTLHLNQTDAADVYGYVADPGTIPVTAGGAIILPTGVYQAVGAGALNPLLQLSLQQYMMDQCVQKVLSATPSQKDSYTTAKAKFDQGVCQLSKCFQQMMVLDYLAQSSSKSSANGGSTDPQEQASAKQISAMLYESTSKSTCSSGSSSVDPNMANSVNSGSSSSSGQ